MKNAELRGMPINALEETLLAQKTTLAKLKSQRASGTKTEKPSMIRTTRRQIARMHTIINEKKRKGEISATEIAKAEAEAIAHAAGDAPKITPKVAPAKKLAAPKKKGAK